LNRLYGVLLLQMMSYVEPIFAVGNSHTSILYFLWFILQFSQHLICITSNSGISDE
jgi:hypothetical protein